MSDYDRLGYRDDILGRVRALAGAVKMRQVRNTKALTFAEMSQDAGSVAIDGLLFADTEFTGDPIGEENGLAWVDEDGNASAIIGTFHDAGTGHINFQIVVPAIIGEIDLISDYTQISVGIGGRVDTGTHFIDGSYAVVAGAGAWKAYGLYIFGPAGTGEVGDTVTRYALYIADPAAGGTVNYSIFTNEGLNRLGDQLEILGSSDLIQLIVKGDAAQASHLAEFQDSAGALEAGFDVAGGLILREKADAPGSPTAGTWIAYFKSTGMFIKASDGTETGPFGSAGPPDASVVTYTPSDNSKWTGNTDPGDVDDALDQLAGRMTTEEGHTHAAPDASVVTYTPAVAADWSGSVDPGNADDALDQLASRITDIDVPVTTSVAEDLTAQVTGATAHFDTGAVFVAGSLQVMDMGVVQNYTSITEDGGLDGFTLDYTPPSGHQLFVRYLTAVGAVAYLSAGSVLATATWSSGDQVVTSLADITGATLTFNMVSGHKYEYVYSTRMLKATTGLVVWSLTDAAGTGIGTRANTIGNGDAFSCVNSFIEVAGSSGSVTRKMKASVSAGNVTLYDSGTEVPYFYVRDLGV